MLGANISYSSKIPDSTSNIQLVREGSLGFYPTPSAINKFKEELSQYERRKGTVKFPLNQPIPLDLINRIVKFRVKENSDKRIY